MSETALQNQIYIALIMYCLLVLVQLEKMLNSSYYNLSDGYKPRSGSLMINNGLGGSTCHFYLDINFLVLRAYKFVQNNLQLIKSIFMQR